MYSLQNNIWYIIKSMYADHHFFTPKFDCGQVTSLNHFYYLLSEVTPIYTLWKLPGKIGEVNTFTFKSSISPWCWNTDSKERRQSPSSIQIDCFCLPLISHVHSPYSLTVHELTHTQCATALSGEECLHLCMSFFVYNYAIGLKRTGYQTRAVYKLKEIIRTSLIFASIKTICRDPCALDVKHWAQSILTQSKGSAESLVHRTDKQVWNWFQEEEGPPQAKIAHICSPSCLLAPAPEASTLEPHASSWHHSACPVDTQHGRKGQFFNFSWLRYLG